MLTFLVWAATTYVLIVVINMVIAIPVGAIAETKWHALQEMAEKEGRPTAAVLPRQTYSVLTVGALIGITLAVSLTTLTHRFISTHWLYKLTLLIYLVSASVHNQASYRESSMGRCRQMFGTTGDRFCLLMFGGYFWGSILGMAFISLLIWAGY